MSGRDDLMQAHAQAEHEKQLAKQSFASLKQALRPSSVLKRIGKKATSKVSEVTGGLADAVRAHPGLTTSLIAGTGLVIASKPLGDLIAGEVCADESVGLP